MSRRRGLRGLTGLAGAGLAGALLLAGCMTTRPAPVGASAAPTTTVPPGKTQVVVGLDGIGPGFNPHALADASPTTRALATLVLPSVFRPDVRGDRQLDRTVATSAEVTSQQPFTVSYELAKDASWSDNAPIAAEDFDYLAQQMRSQPGVADAAGYQLITEVRSRAGGKAVEVVFAHPYPAWRTLFSDLLPAHLLKDAPGAWSGALNDNIPVSGGPFAVESVDRSRGQITLVRNDHYWATPAVADRIVLQVADPASLVDRVRSGDTQVAQLRADATTLARLQALPPPFHVSTVPQPDVVQLVLRTDSGPLADPRVRRAVAASLDRDALIAQGTGSGPGARLRADAQVLAPSAPDYHPTIPPGGVPARPDPAEAARLLTAAGYLPGRDGTWRRAGEPLRITVGAASGQQPYTGLAQAVARQLTAAGVAASAVAPTADALYTQGLAAPTATPTPVPVPTPTPGPVPTPTPPSGTTTAPGPTAEDRSPPVDVAVVPRPVGGDPATELAANYGCPTSDGDGGAVRAPSNLSGFCDPSLQPLLEGALTGAGSVGTALAVAEPTLWSELPAIPLFQLTTVLVSDGRVPGVGVGPLLTGPLTGAQRWPPPTG